MDFRIRFRDYSSLDLLRIINSGDEYQPAAREAARSLLAERQLNPGQIAELEQILQAEKQQKEKLEEVRREKKKAREEKVKEIAASATRNAEALISIPRSIPNAESLQKARTPIVLLMLAMMIFSLYFSADHYSDGGCDGGLCALAYFFHGAPLLLSWICTIVAFVGYSYNKNIFLGVLLLAMIIAGVTLLQDFGYRLSELKIPLYGILVLQFALLSLFIRKIQAAGE